MAGRQLRPYLAGNYDPAGRAGWPYAEVYAALMQLPAIQARRIYARFYLGMAVKEIAQIEGVDRRRVWASIRRGLKKLAYLLDANK